ncbi:hypothetical protein EV702DRAFT_1050658 [Suillus placidus]|uniref:Uncharacterized protein n=1 Tax=Suillus placidus TaxID=48579 RepID=A0A9P6ZHG1_9AGAM|nr:hypothetical protein EV702DRAFT_1050658 [Suillus placidus]
MAGSSSETDEEAPKQLPLTEEEVAVLEGYLEQWDSTSGKERNVVWGEATKEARLQAPPMDAALLKSQKTSLRKKELLKKIEDKTGVKPREQGMMNHYSKYLTEMVESLTEEEVKEATETALQWNKQGVPPEVQANIVRRKSDNILLYVAKEMFKRAGMRLFMLSAWKTEKGKLMVSSHNYNDEVRKGESFSKCSDWQTILPEWEAYARKQFDANDLDDLVVKKGRKDNAYALEMGEDGFPILPNHAEMDSDTRKAVVRAFLNWHYPMTEDCSGKPKDPVPWKEVIPRQEELIPPPYLPDGRTIREPSRMNQHKATELLDFWYNRQQTCRDIVFEFYGWWSKADKEVKPPVNVIRGKGKTRTRTKRKSAVQMVDSDSSGDEDNNQVPKAKSIYKTAVPKTKGMTKPTKQDPKSKSRVNQEGSEDEFNAPDSSEESSDDDVPAVGKGNAKKTHLRKQPAVPAHVNPALPGRPSVVQPTAAVGPASRPGGALRSKLGDPSKQTAGEPRRGKKHGVEVVLQGSPEKRVRVETNRKKRSAEDLLEGSPAKRTRSKTTDVPPKRSKKPNSRYTTNFVWS